MSRTKEKATLATENYGKTKKRKFSYQKPPSRGKLGSIINEVLSSEPNKKRNNEKKLQVQLNFRRKKSFEKEKNKEKPSSHGVKKKSVKSYR